MPSFKEISVAAAASLVEFVRWLGMRGFVERQLAYELAFAFDRESVAERRSRGESLSAITLELQRYLDEDFLDVAEQAAASAFTRWERSEQESGVLRPKGPMPSSSQESVARGKALFQSHKGKCFYCHGAEGRGDGKLTRAFHLRPDGSQYKEPGLHDTWGRLSKMPDLTRDAFRGGAGPDDLFRRIQGGISGTAMPPYGHVLTEEDVWNLVQFIYSTRSPQTREIDEVARRTPPPGSGGAP